MLWDDSGALLGIAGVVVGLIGIILSVFFYFRSKNKKILEYEITSTQLITKKMTSIPKLKVTIDNQPVKTLASTTIKFFNAGNQSIVFSDFATKEPLGITITGRLHSCDVSADNPNSTPNLVAIDDKTFYVKFDFLKQNQSFSITLLHDGKITVLGELTNGERREYRNPLTDRKYVYALISSSLVAGTITGFILSPSVFNSAYLLNAVLVTVAAVLLLTPLFSELCLLLFRKIMK